MYILDGLRVKILEPRTINFRSVKVGFHGLNIQNLLKSRSKVASNPMQGDKGNKIELNIEIKCNLYKNGVF